MSEVTFDPYKTPKKKKEEPAEPIQAKPERFDHIDPILGALKLAENREEEKIRWVSEKGMEVAVENGKIVKAATIRKDGNSQDITRIFTSQAKLDSFAIKDPKAGIDVSIKVSYENDSMRRFMRQVREGVDEPVYKGHKMRTLYRDSKENPEEGVWLFKDEAKGEWIAVELIKDEAKMIKDPAKIGVVVRESEVHDSFVKMDVKQFDLYNRLLSIFNSGTDFGDAPTIDVKKEEGAMSELLDRSEKLRGQIAELQEFQKFSDVIGSGFSLMYR